MLIPQELQLSRFFNPVLKFFTTTYIPLIF